MSFESAVRQRIVSRLRVPNRRIPVLRCTEYPRYALRRHRRSLVSLGEAARRTGLHRSTTHHLLQSLVGVAAIVSSTCNPRSSDW
ncbi:helix-turn-helix domain-containing protein [Bradyrhizobium sp. RDT10]